MMSGWMKNGFAQVTLVLAMALSISTANAGRGDKVGTASGTQLLIPVSPRAIALGNATLASAHGVHALTVNPAGLSGGSDRASVAISHMSYLADIGVNHLAVGGSLTDGMFVGFSVKALTFGKIAITTEDAPDGTGETTSPIFLTFGGTIARKISDNISMGVTVHLLREEMAAVNATGVAFDAGVQYRELGGIPGLSVGVAIKNLGPPLRFSGDGLDRTGQIDDVLRPEARYQVIAAAGDLPSTIEVGLSYKRALADLGNIQANAQFQNNNFANDEYKVGIEYAYAERFILRAGGTFATEEPGKDYIYGPSFGFGVHTMVASLGVAVDYAYRSVQFFEGNHVLGIGIEF